MSARVRIEAGHANVPQEQIAAQISASRARGLPRVENFAPAHAGVVSIVGGGPSVHRESIFAGDVWALNGAAKYLRWRGVRVQAVVVCDAQEISAEHLHEAPEDCVYYIGTQCHPAVFEQLIGRTVVTFDSPTLGEDHGFMIYGGSTVGLQAIALAYVLGYRQIHLYGMDSSYSEHKHHAYWQPANDGDRLLEIEAAGRKFVCADWMVAQVSEFQSLAPALLGCSTIVHGDGLLPHVARQMAQAEKAAAS